MARPLSKTLLGAMVPLVLMTAPGCSGDDQASDQEELQVLLRDKDITHMTQSALTTPPPPPKGG
ncbi:MAG: hypothetical protein JWM82_2701, partial [Myxococcales bacterium]|nr:hypothetical protein [Myxococcales bacterium]